MEKPVMWLDAYVNGAGESEYAEKFDYLIFVSLVDTEDSIYFEMPENRRNSCATALFKRFIKFYKENYEGQLVYANFGNYALQEKFRVACEKGIFPKESLELIGETTEDEYDEHEQYNINNRELMYETYKEIANSLREKGNEVNIERRSVIINANKSLNEIANDIESTLEENILDEDLSSEELYCFNNNGKTTVTLFSEQPDFNFLYDIAGSIIRIPNAFYADEIISNMKQYEEENRIVFEGVQTISTGKGNFTVDEFFNDKEVQAKIKRLRK